MRLQVEKKLLFTPQDIAPSNKHYRVLGIFNPGAVSHNNAIYLLTRIAEEVISDSEDYVCLPKWSCDKGYCYDMVPLADLDILDRNSAVRFKHNGLVRMTHISHFRLAILEKDGITVRQAPVQPLLFPEMEYEEFGIEDPRIIPIGNRFYITYVAVSRHGVVTALMSTEDFISFERHGIIFPPENKDVVLFPEKINDRYYAIHRARGGSSFGKPELWIADSPDLIHWGGHRSLMEVYYEWTCLESEKGAPVCRMLPRGGRRSADWDRLRVGGGAPPIKTGEGWLEIYHGVYAAGDEAPVGVYCAGAALFDLNDPSLLIARSPEPIIIPTEDFETLQGKYHTGFTANVVFPSGIIRQEDDLLIYCGVADSATSLCKLSLSEVLATVKKGAVTYD